MGLPTTDMATLDKTPATNGVPEQGQLVEVRARPWVVAEVEASSLADRPSSRGSGYDESFSALTVSETDIGYEALCPPHRLQRPSLKRATNFRSRNPARGLSPRRQPSRASHSHSLLARHTL